MYSDTCCKYFFINFTNKICLNRYKKPISNYNNFSLQRDQMNSSPVLHLNLLQNCVKMSWSLLSCHPYTKLSVTVMSMCATMQYMHWLNSVPTFRSILERLTNKPWKYLKVSQALSVNAWPSSCLQLPTK